MLHAPPEFSPSPCLRFWSRRVCEVWLLRQPFLVLFDFSAHYQHGVSHGRVHRAHHTCCFLSKGGTGQPMHRGLVVQEEAMMEMGAMDTFVFRMGV